MIDDDRVPPLGVDSVPSVPEARPQSFALAEMITCDTCLRANPPTRSNCLYCAAILPVHQNAADPQPAFDPAGEISHEASASSGFYVVLAANQGNVAPESALAEVAALLHVKTTEVQACVGRPVPLACAVTLDQATMLAERLRALGIAVDTFKPGELNLDLPGKKVRALEFSDAGLTAILLSGGESLVTWDDLILIVTGLVLTKRLEVEERRRRGRSQPLDSRELFSDELVVDFYVRSHETGFRISASSFDFSCLGSEKAMTAFENSTRLINTLRTRAPSAEVDEGYRNLKAVLANVWPLDPRTRKGEWRRSGAGKMDVATVTTIDNESQFNNYSRLRQQLKLRERKGDG